MDALATVLLRRAGAVALPVPATAAAPAREVTAFEADLARRGWLLEPALRTALTALDAPTRMRWSDFITATADAVTGVDRDHTPLFRRFPGTPARIAERYADRIIVHLCQDRHGPCVLCGATRRLEPLDPCGHPVCTECFSPEDYAACPICGMRPRGASGFLPVPAKPKRPPAGPPLRLRRITLTRHPESLAARLRDDLVARPTALSEADRDDLRVLVAATAPGRLDWLPETVPARETLAVVLAWALHVPGTVDQVAARWGTVTDVARTLWAYSGGDPGLVLPAKPAPDGPNEGWRPWHEPKVTVPVTRVRALSRPLRRAVLSFLDGVDPALSAEDVARHPVVWKRLAERLHPFERVAAHPTAAAVFAALRGTRAPGVGALGRAMADVAARRPHRLLLVRHGDGRVSLRIRTHAATVEAALGAYDAPAAVALLGERPGDLWRRLDHLLRICGDNPDALRTVLDAAAASAPRVAPGVLAGAAAALQGRDETVPAGYEAVAAARKGASARQAAHAAYRSAVADDRGRRTVTVRPVVRRAVAYRGPRPGTPRRTFFPKGDAVRTWTEPEQRPPLPTAAIDEIRRLVDAELSGRAAGQAAFDLAVLDATLARVPAPARERAGSEQLAGWPRGSVRSIAGSPVWRLFLHWVDRPKDRVDLDLSCAFYGPSWEARGECDYTNLRYAKGAAEHSGDYTSAPAPQGATEFLDLDRAALAAQGVEWAVPVVLAYNDVPFEALTEAFAGLALPPSGRAPGLHPSTVLQRFGLRGNAKSMVPMVLHVPTGEVMWVDASLTVRGYGHSVGKDGPGLGRLAADLWEHFSAGNRATVLDLAAWHAVARADRVLIRHADGTCTEVPYRADPAAAVAAVRNIATAPTGRPMTQTGTARVFAAAADASVLTGLPAAEGSVAVLVDGVASAPWSAVAVTDLAAGLVPAS